MKKIYLLVLFVMCFLISAVTVKAEELEVGNLLSGWKLSGDVSMFATFKGEERNTDSKLNFMYMQFYGEKEIQKNLTLYLSLVVNNVGYDNDVNDYETTILVDTAFLSYAVNDVFSLHIGREIINYGYENPICIIDEKFAFLPIVTPARIIAPAPIDTPSLIIVSVSIIFLPIFGCMVLVVIQFGPRNTSFPSLTPS